MTTSLILNPSQMHGNQLQQLVQQCLMIAQRKDVGKSPLPVLNTMLVFPDSALGRVLAATPDASRPVAKW